MAQNRLLVCDDEADFRFFIRTYAESIGFAVREVEESADCVAAVADFNPDIVVLDVVMPAPDGIEVVRALARAGYTGRVVIISGYNPHFLKAASVFGTLEGLTITTLQKPMSIADLEKVLAPSARA